MIVSELLDVLRELPADTSVHVIFDGVIDKDPSFNVEEDVIYIEGSAS